MKNSKGITLIALVITIIVLLILAGVSLSLVLGQNGTLGQASSAVIKNKCATAKEKLVLALADAETEYNVQWTNDVTVARSSVYPARVYTDLKDVYSAVAIKGYTTDEGALPTTNVTAAGQNSDWIKDTDPAVTTFSAGNAAPTTWTIKIVDTTGDIYYFDVKLNEKTGKSVISETVAYQPGASKPVEVFTLK